MPALIQIQIWKNKWIIILFKFSTQKLIQILICNYNYQGNYRILNEQQNLKIDEIQIFGIKLIRLFINISTNLDENQFLINNIFIKELQQNMYKKNYINKKNDKEFLEKGYRKQIHTDPQQFYQIFKKDRGIKFIQNQHPHYHQLTLCDVQLQSRGPSEDKIYSDFAYYRNNIRRGNSLVILQENNNQKYFWVRRGLKKFFDVHIQCLIGQHQGKNDHTATFRQIQNVLSCNDKMDQQSKSEVIVYKILKANGQNSQVSYFKPRGLWMISSKNVSILIANKNDLLKYHEERYKFAVLIAYTWFNILEKNKYKQQQIAEIKNYLSNRTLVGEYCGNPEFQHIIKYEQTTILFYASVLNDSPLSCQPPEQTFNFLQKYKIPIVRGYQKSLIGKFEDYQQLCQFISKIFNEVAVGKIQQQQEGSVLYFVIKADSKFYQRAINKNLQDRFYIPKELEKINYSVASLCKLKTFEYRILRKLREKLKRTETQDDKSLEKTYARFEKQTFQLIKSQKLQKPIQYYFFIGLRAFQYIKKYKKVPNALELQKLAYIDFLNVIMYCVENELEVTPNLMNDNELVIKLRKIDWKDYSIHKEKEYLQLLEELFPGYMKIKGKKNLYPQQKEQQDIEIQKE